VYNICKFLTYSHQICITGASDMWAPMEHSLLPWTKLTADDLFTY